MKKSLLLLFTLCALLTACSDNDLTAEEEQIQAEIEAADPYGKNSEEGLATYCALNMLCNVDSLPDNWRSATFEPTYGYAIDQANPYVRTVYVDDISEAENCFRSLGGTINGGDASATYEVGSLKYVYTALNQTDLFATIDVSVPQIPNLGQLRFVPNSAQDENGLFGYSWKEGDVPYYQIGDVVQRDEDKTLWVCVRPAYKGLKDKSHWVSIDEKQMQLKEYKKGGGFIVPTKLGTNVEHINNFAQLMAALQNPDVYTGALATNSFGLEDGRISQKLIKSVAAEWDLPIYGDNKQTIWQLLKTGKDYFDSQSDELNLFYKGYSCWGFNMTLYWMHYNEQAGYYPTSKKDKAITPMEYEWKLADSQFNIYQYLTSKKYGYSDNAGGSNEDALPTKAVCVWNYDYSGDPTQPMKGFTQISFKHSQPEQTATDHAYLSIGDVLVDADDCKWFCVSHATDDHPCGYFVSFEFPNGASEQDIYGQLPPRDFIPCILPYLAAIHNMQLAKIYDATNGASIVEAHLRTKGQFNPRTLATVRTFRNIKDDRDIPNSYFNALSDDGTIVRAKLLMDKNETNYNFTFADRYNDGVAMRLSDVASTTLVQKYAKDDPFSEEHYGTLNKKEYDLICQGNPCTYRTATETLTLSDILARNNLNEKADGFYKHLSMFMDGYQVFRVCRVYNTNTGYLPYATIQKQGSSTAYNITFKHIERIIDNTALQKQMNSSIEDAKFQQTSVELTFTELLPSFFDNATKNGETFKQQYLKDEWGKYYK